MSLRTTHRPVEGVFKINIHVRSAGDRCPGDSYQDILHNDGSAVHPVLSIEANCDLGAADIPFDRYTSPEFFKREMDKMWRRVWQYACREEHIPQTGDYYVYDIGQYSIVVVRAKEGQVKAYFNSCRHRGTKLKPSGSEGYSPSIQCPYHGWTWTLEGSLKDVPCSWDFPHVKPGRYDLLPVRAEIWNSLVFITMDKDAPPLIDYLEVMPEHFKDWSFDDWYISVHAQKELSCNWKAAQDAFIEGYHTYMVHPQVLPVAGDINGQHDIFGDHTSRDLIAIGVPSPRFEGDSSEQDIVDKMLMGDRSAIEGGGLTVPAGMTARTFMANQLRASMKDEYGLDLSKFTDAEMIDSIKYTVFPNLFVFAGISIRILYQYRPLGMSPDRCLFDVMFMRPIGQDGHRPDPAPVTHITEDERFSDIPGMDPGFGLLLDQDTSILRWQQEGFKACEGAEGTYSRYIESRLRHNHEVLDKYLRK